jgi:hypothetical protein
MQNFKTLNGGSVTLNPYSHGHFVGVLIMWTSEVLKCRGTSGMPNFTEVCQSLVELVPERLLDTCRSFGKVLKKGTVALSSL